VPTEKKTQQVPSIGRIVHYTLPFGPGEGQLRPATIMRVWSDTCVNLNVQLIPGDEHDGALVRHYTSVAMDESPEHHELGRWHWPPYAPAK
jgi:hypothetical protein